MNKYDRIGLGGITAHTQSASNSSTELGVLSPRPPSPNADSLKQEWDEKAFSRGISQGRLESDRKWQSVVKSLISMIYGLLNESQQLVCQFYLQYY